MPEEYPSPEKTQAPAPALAALREARYAIAMASVVFALSILIGYSRPEAFSFLMEMLEDLAEQVEGRGFIGTALFIFSNNLKAAAVALLLGSIFGLVPVAHASANGVVIGMVAASMANGKGLLIFAMGLLPHGILEIPAMLLAWGLGIWLGSWPMLGDGRRFSERVSMAARAALHYIVPLLAGAALIEAFLIQLLQRSAS
jgi:stage II sporulation protein M